MAITRTAAAVVGSVLVASLLAGCAAHQQSPAAPAHRTAQKTTASTVHTLTGPSDHLIPTLTHAPAGTRSVPWTATLVTTQRVYLEATSASTCTAPQYVTLNTTPTTVIIGVYATPLPPGTVCTDELTTLLGYVQVPGGLKHRTLTTPRTH